MSTEPLLLTIGATAQALSCSTRLVEKLIASGDLRSLRLGKRARRVPQAAIFEYIEMRLGETGIDPLMTVRPTTLSNGHAKAEGWRPRHSQQEVRRGTAKTSHQG